MKIANNRKLKFSPAAGICIAIVAVCLAFASQASAITFDGKTSGIFVNPTGPSGVKISKVNTKRFRWGTPYQSHPSALVFAGKGFSAITTDEFFNLGKLSYFNGTILSGTGASSVDLRASLAFTNPFELTKNFNFDFNLINTPNTGSAAQNADSVLLSSFLPATIFTIDGIDYTLKMGFGSLKRGLFSQLNEFVVVEGGKASAKLIGIITASKPQSVPDSGSTLALMAMAVVGVGGLRQYLSRKA